VASSGGAKSAARPTPPVFLFGLLAFLIITAITALGMKTSLLALACIGMVPVMLLIIETVFISRSWVHRARALRKLLCSNKLSSRP
jgi:hypothetical protein